MRLKMEWKYTEESKNVFDKKYANTITSSRSTWSPGPRTVFYPADGKSVYVGFKYHF
ncbi:hypothetical protein HMPREF9466_00530 [Fusobacterium necrophorum subsp. funduliforme 1_1_36S]|nr:hypothetical protein HMPREF9466_00530 [Fusobacterium necrophorum subsp. funduliforme 1_1_36S]